MLVGGMLALALGRNDLPIHISYNICACVARLMVFKMVSVLK